MNMRPSQFSSRSVLQTLEELGRLGVWSRDCQTGEEYCSPGLTQLLGGKITPESLTLQHLVDLVHPDDRTKVASASGLEAYALDTETEIRIIQPAGNLRWLRMRNTVLFWPNGQPKTIMYIFVDITGQQQATEVLRQHEQLLDALAESFKIALFTKTQDGKCLDSQLAGPWAVVCDPLH